MFGKFYKQFRDMFFRFISGQTDIHIADTLIAILRNHRVGNVA